MVIGIFLTPRVSGQGGRGGGRKAEIRPSNDPLTLLHRRRGVWDVAPPAALGGPIQTRFNPFGAPAAPLTPAQALPTCTRFRGGCGRWAHHFADPNEFRVIHRGFAF